MNPRFVFNHGYAIKNQLHIYRIYDREGEIRDLAYVERSSQDTWKVSFSRLWSLHLLDYTLEIPTNCNFNTLHEAKRHVEIEYIRTKF